jgi:hypothetical protein
MMEIEPERPNRSNSGNQSAFEKTGNGIPKPTGF